MNLTYSQHYIILFSQQQCIQYCKLRCICNYVTYCKSEHVTVNLRTYSNYSISEPFQQLYSNIQKMDIPGTQLADSKPRVNQALRVSIPVNVPQRIPALTREKYIFKYAFSPNAFVITKKHTLLLAEQHKEDLEWIDTDLHSPPIPNLSLLDIDHDALIKTAAKDFSVLSQSNKRAGKRDIEATSFASLAVVQDNQFQYLHAIEGYKAYLQICDEIGDIIGAAAACNNIGVDYMLLAVPMSDAGFQSNVKPHPDVVGYLEQAVVYHQKHLDLGPDSGGRFVANTNLGLCYGMLQNINRAAKHQQDALRISIKMQSLHGQCMAVGNLGILALMKRDFATTRSCFDQVSERV